MGLVLAVITLVLIMALAVWLLITSDELEEETPKPVKYKTKWIDETSQFEVDPGWALVHVACPVNKRGIYLILKED